MEDGAEELEDLVHFSVSELPSRGYGVMEEIRRQGKLCDVTLKVPRAGRRGAVGKGTERGERGAGLIGEERSSEQRGEERRLEGDRIGEREVPSGRGGLGLSGRRTGTAFQPLEGKAERCATEALGMGDIGVPASLFCHTDKRKWTCSPSTEKGAVAVSTL